MTQPTTDTLAYSEICSRARDVLQGPAMVAIVGYVPEIRYMDQLYRTMADSTKLWFRLSLSSTSERKRTLGRPSRVTYHGIVDIQLFVPAASARAAELASRGAALARTTFVGSTANVEFFTVSVKDMPKEEQWFYKRINAVCNFDIYE